MAGFWWNLVHRLKNTCQVQKTRKRGSAAIFQDGHRCQLENQSEAVSQCPGTIVCWHFVNRLFSQTCWAQARHTSRFFWLSGFPSVKSIAFKSGLNKQPNCQIKQQILIVKNDIVLERNVVWAWSSKKAKIFFIRWKKLPYSYNRWLGNHCFKAGILVNYWSFCTRGLLLKSYSWSRLRSPRRLQLPNRLACKHYIHCPLRFLDAFIKSRACT